MSILDVFTKIAATLRGEDAQPQEQPQHVESPLSLGEELEQMREQYKAHPYKEEGLPKPFWIEADQLGALYDECDTLFEKGQIYYGYIVQANDALFRDRPKMDYPANIVYSEDPIVNENPAILREVAARLFKYKGMPLKSVPEELREVVAAIKGERSCQTYDIHMKFGEDHDIVIKFMTIMIFRKYLPSNKLIGSLMPIMAYPEKCKTIMVLPKTCWNESFINGYWY